MERNTEEIKPIVVLKIIPYFDRVYKDLFAKGLIYALPHLYYKLFLQKKYAYVAALSKKEVEKTFLEANELFHQGIKTWEDNQYKEIPVYFSKKENIDAFIEKNKKAKKKNKT